MCPATWYWTGLEPVEGCFTSIWAPQCSIRALFATALERTIEAREAEVLEGLGGRGGMQTPAHMCRPFLTSGRSRLIRDQRQEVLDN